MRRRIAVAAMAMCRRADTGDRVDLSDFGRGLAEGVEISAVAGTCYVVVGTGFRVPEESCGDDVLTAAHP